MFEKYLCLWINFSCRRFLCIAVGIIIVLQYHYVVDLGTQTVDYERLWQNADNSNNIIRFK